MPGNNVERTHVYTNSEIIKTFHSEKVWIMICDLRQELILYVNIFSIHTANCWTTASLRKKKMVLCSLFPQIRESGVHTTNDEKDMVKRKENWTQPSKMRVSDPETSFPQLFSWVWAKVLKSLKSKCSEASSLFSYIFNTAAELNSTKSRRKRITLYFLGGCTKDHW